MDKKSLDLMIGEIQNGSEEAFERFYLETNKSLFSFVYLLVRDYQDAEDIVQETFIKIKKNILLYKLGTNPIAWIYQIAKNLSLDHLKKKKFEAPLFENEEYAVTSEDISGNKIQNLYLHNLLIENLEEDERQIVLLHIVDGYKHREIAQILGLPLGTVLWKYNRALKTLKNKIKEEV